MTEEDAVYETTHGPTVRFRYPGDKPDVLERYSDEEREIRRAAIRFASNVMLLSRTTRAGKLRLLCAEYIVTGSPWPNTDC
jgi:hypothetical protein